jgi:IS30 family transposase
MPPQRVTFPEREQIEMYLRMKKKKTWIAKKLGRDPSVIKREIRRNSGEHLPYTAHSAQGIADRNAKKTNSRKLEKEKHRELKMFVEESLRKGHSPEQIAGRMRVREPSVLKPFTSISVPGLVV